MAKPRTQRGYLFEASNAFHVRFYTLTHGGRHRRQRSRKLCDVAADTPSKDSPRVQQLAAEFMQGVNAAVALERSKPRPQYARNDKGHFTGPVLKELHESNQNQTA